MPENGKSDESGNESPLNVDWDSKKDDLKEKIIGNTSQESKRKTRAEKDIDWQSVRTTDSNLEKEDPNKHWKEEVGDTLQPANYTILLHETDIEAAHTMIKKIFDDITEYHIWRTETHYSGYKQRRRGNYNLQVYIRTLEPTPVDELPDHPRPRMW